LAAALCTIFLCRLPETVPKAEMEKTFSCREYTHIAGMNR
jgi:hypothetical protein